MLSSLQNLKCTLILVGQFLLLIFSNCSILQMFMVSKDSMLFSTQAAYKFVLAFLLLDFYLRWYQAYIYSISACMLFHQTIYNSWYYKFHLFLPNWWWKEQKQICKYNSSIYFFCIFLYHAKNISFFFYIRKYQSSLPYS